MAQGVDDQVPFDLGDGLVERGDAVADVAGLAFLGLGLGQFLLAHERADLLGDCVALRLELLDLGQRRAAAVVKGEDLGDLRLIAGMAGGEAFLHEVGFVPEQLDVEHVGGQ